MVTQIHLVGQFSNWNTAKIISAIRPRLLGRLLYWPIADMDIEPPEHAINAVQAAKDAGFIPADARAQITVHISEELEFRFNFIENFFKKTSEIAIQFDIQIWKITHEENRSASAINFLCLKIAKIINALSDDVPVILHFCCASGDIYSMSPRDMELMVELSNQLLPRLTRPVSRLHFPVPLTHNDDSYFKSLIKINDKAQAILCLGIIHASDGVPGAIFRWSLAKRYVSRFSVGPRCGFAARSNEDIFHFLDLNAAVGLRLDKEI